MKIKILQDNVPVYVQVDTESAPTRTLQMGEFAETGKIKNVRGKKWVEVSLADGTRGFIAGDTRSFTLMRATTNQPKTSLLAIPAGSWRQVTWHWPLAMLYMSRLLNASSWAAG